MPELGHFSLVIAGCMAPTSSASEQQSISFNFSFIKVEIEIVNFFIFFIIFHQCSVFLF